MVARNIHLAVQMWILPAFYPGQHIDSRLYLSLYFLVNKISPPPSGEGSTTRELPVKEKSTICLYHSPSEYLTAWCSRFMNSNTFSSSDNWSLTRWAWFRTLARDSSRVQ